MTKKLVLIGAALAVIGTGVFAGSKAWRRYHQLVTLKVRNAPLADVVKRIERQTGKKVNVDPKLDARITLDVRNQKLAKVLDRIAEQAGARWSTTYAVYRDPFSLRRLEPLLAVSSSDSDYGAAGWTNLAPKFNPPPMPDENGNVITRGGPGDGSMAFQNSGGSATFESTEDVKKLVDKMVEQGATLKQSADGSVRTVTVGGQGGSGRKMVMVNGDGKATQSAGGPAGPAEGGRMISVRRMVGPGGTTTTTSDGSGAVHIMKMSSDGKILQEDVWSPEKLVIEAGLTSRLGDDVPAAANPETAAQTASKVHGKFVTYYALDKSPVPLDPDMSRLAKAGLQPSLSANGTNGPLAGGNIPAMLEERAQQRKLEALSKSPEEQVQRARLKQAAQSPN